VESARWQDLESLFHAARELHPEDHAEFAALHCHGNNRLELELLALLATDAAGGSFIETPATRIELPPDITRLGPYQIVRRLGQGGMGDVFLGRRDDAEYEKDVALKVIRGSWVGAEVVARFRRERQILAHLEHPDIARLLDGGATAEGLPYLVMEFVDGEPIDVYADHHQLDVAARLGLIRRVADALAFAHRNLVVHRDIKPSNILVTADGDPKLLDFGIAKIMADDGQPADLTATAARMMTLEYASPEQVRGRAVTTASDVYSLGVVLYRLLTGRSPYRAGAEALDDITRAICDTEPVRPSVAARGAGGQVRAPLNRDVDAIVLKALRKEPERRYSSMEQFSDDIGRLMAGRPVVARQGTWTYRAGKFVSRHRAAVIASVLVATAAAVGVSSIITERTRAIRRFNDVRDLAHAVVFDYHDAIEKLPGSTPVRERLIRDALKYLDGLSQDAAGDRALQRELATAYQKIGDIQGNTFYANLGNTQQALDNLKKSLALREALVAADPSDAESAFELARSHDRVGDILWERNDLKGALSEFARAVAVLEGQHAEASADVQRRLDLGAGHEKMADVLGNPGFANLGDSTGALAHYRRSLAIRESAALLAPNNHDVQSALFGSNHRLGAALRVTGDPAGAIAHVQKALAIQQSLYAAEPTASQQRILGIAYSRTADELDAAGHVVEARDYTRQALAVFQELFTKDATYTRAHRELAVMQRKVARFSLKAGDATGALQTYAEANRLTASLAALDPKNSEITRDLFVGYKGIGDALAALHRPGDALVQYHKAISLSQSLIDSAPNNAQARGDVALAHAAVGALLEDSGDLAGAIAAYRRSATARDAIVASDPTSAVAQTALAWAWVQLANALKKTGVVEGEQHLRRAIDLWKALEHQGKLTSSDKRRLADAERSLSVGR